jgi:hypothetical protein
MKVDLVAFCRQSPAFFCWSRRMIFCAVPKAAAGKKLPAQAALKGVSRPVKILFESLEKSSRRYRERR